jgi:hypothetical protein
MARGSSMPPNRGTADNEISISLTMWRCSGAFGFQMLLFQFCAIMGLLLPKCLQAACIPPKAYALVDGWLYTVHFLRAFNRD